MFEDRTNSSLGRGVCVFGAFAVALLLLSGCATEQEDEAYFSERCSFNETTFAKVEVGSPEHQHCVEKMRSGIDPDEDMHDGDGDR